MTMKSMIMAAIAVLASGHAAAQQIQEVAPGVHSGDSLTMLVDSLQQEMRSLKSSNQELEEDSRNRRIWNDRAKYFNIAYVNQSLTQKDINGTWRSNLGVALTSGRTYYLHKKPILGMIKFGIDWSYFDINFAKYEDKFGFFGGDVYDSSQDGGNYYDPGDYGTSGGDDGTGVETEDMYQAEIGMSIGPSVTVNPVDELKASLYFRLTPTMSMLYAAEEFSTSYGTFFSFGGAVAWKAISLGIEGRWGNVKYDSMFDLSELEDIEDGGDIDLSGDEPSAKWKVGSMRFYISLRF